MKRVIVFVSFGVENARVRAECLDKTAFELARAFPKYSVVQAYTSEFVRGKMEKQGLRALSLSSCLEELYESGCENAYIQPSHLTAGEEYENKIVAVAKVYKDRFKNLIVGEPLIFDDNDYDDVLAALLEALDRQDDEEIVLIGHGSPHFHNPVCEILQQKADAMKLPLTTGVIEKSDTPNFDEVCRRLKHKKKTNLLLAPLLVADGSHVTKDIAGDDKDSWKSMLEAEGFSVRIDNRGLLRRSAFRAICIKKAGRLIGENPDNKNRVQK